MTFGDVRSWLVAALLLGMLHGQVLSAATLAVDPDAERIRLGPHLTVIPDPDGTWTFDEVAAGRADAAALPPTTVAPNIGYVRHPWWVRFDLHNPSDRELERILVLRRGTKHIQEITLRDGSLETAGRTRTLRIGQDGTVSGDVESRHAVVRVTLPPRGTVAATIRLNSRTGATLDYELTTERALASADSLDWYFYGVLFGVGLALGTYAIFLFVATRERLYAWFAGFALCGVTYQMHFEGFAFVAVWKDYQLVGNYASLYIGVAYALSTIGFLRTIIEAPRFLPRADRWLFRPLFVLLFAAFPLFPFHWWLANILTAAGITASTFALGGAALVTVFRGNVRVRTIPIAVVVLALAGTLFMLKQAGVVPDLPIFAVLFPLTLGVAMLTFAMAIAERVRLIAEDNRLAVKRNEERLAHMVAERTEELSIAKEGAERALDRLKTAQRELVAAEKLASLGQLVAGVAHEINTPIGVAITAASYLSGRSAELRKQLTAGSLAKSELEAYADAAEQSAKMVGSNLERAAHLIRTFKQVSVDRSSDDRRRFKLAQYVRDLVESLELTWKRRPIRLEIDVDETLELDSYPGALGQVITNLIQNALLHAYEGEHGGTMRIAARRSNPGGVDLVFSDDGKGIDAESLLQVFEPFFTTKRNRGGTGLGLHIVYNLVTQRLGGRIAASGAPGEGMRFDIHVPATAPIPKRAEP